MSSLARPKAITISLLVLLYCFGLISVLAENEEQRSIRGNHQLASSDPRKLRATLTELSGEQNVKMPILFAMGQGTTGTRTLFHAMCHLNVTGVHYGQGCFKVERARDLSHNEIVAIQAQHDLVHLTNDLAKCAGRVGKSCPLKEALAILHEIKEGVARVIFSGTVDFIADTPYPHLFSFVNEAMHHARPGLEPLYMMTERNAHSWAVRRIAMHSEHVFCRYYFDLELEDLPKFDAEHPDHDPLDWDHCIKYAARPTPVEEAVATDVFVTLEQLVSEAKDNPNRMQRLVARTRSAYERYQKKCLEMKNLIYTYDFFKQNERTKNEHLAIDLYERLFNSNMLPPHIMEALDSAGVSILDTEDPKNRGILTPKKVGGMFINTVMKMK